MPLPPSFADTFRPKARSQSTPVGSLPFAPGAAGTAMQEQSREMRLSREQARHCRLWNYIAIDANAQKAAEDIPHVGYVSADGEKIPDPNHPLAQLFRNVNPIDWWQSFAHELFMMWGLFRRVVVWMNPNAFGVPVELWVIPTTWAEPKVDRDGVVRFWEITPTSGGQPFRVAAEEIFCAQSKHPNSKTVPLSPTEAGAEWILSSEIIERARHQTYEHGPLQSMMLELDPEHHQGITPDLVEAVGEKFMARYQGWAKAGKPIVMAPGITAKSWNIKPNEMLTGEQADQLRDNVLALHKTPRFAVGIAHDLNKATAEVAEQCWYDNAINPMRSFVAGALTEYVASLFEDGLTVWYDPLAPSSAEESRKDVDADAKNMIGSLNELRAQRGYEPSDHPDADTPILFLKQAAAREQKSKPDKEDETAADDSEDEPAAGSGTPESASASHGLVVRQSAAKRDITAEFERHHDATSELGERRAAEFLRKLSREVGARWDAGARVVDDLLPNSIAKAGFNSAMVPAWAYGTAAGVKWEQENLGIAVVRQRVPSIRINIPPRMRRELEAWLDARRAGVWSLVAESTRRDMAEAIAAGIAAGQGMDEIKRRLDEVINDKARAATIGQTEATGSINAGAQILREHQGIAQKQWLSTGDTLTRGTHSAASGQITDNNGEFVVGGYRMKHPGDGSLGAPASEIVRCRCCATGYVDTSID